MQRLSGLIAASVLVLAACNSTAPASDPAPAATQVASAAPAAPAPSASALGEAAAGQQLFEGDGVGRLFPARHAHTERRQRLAQPLHVHVHRALLDEHVVAPDAIEQLRAAVHALGVRHQEVQQAELGRAEVHRLAVGGEAATTLRMSEDQIKQARAQLEQAKATLQQALQHANAGSQDGMQAAAERRGGQP